jgi:hypothetical protein
LGLKNPLSVFWPAVEAAFDAAADFERLAGTVGGCGGLFRGMGFETEEPSGVTSGPFESIWLGVGNACSTLVAVVRFSTALALGGDWDGMLGGLRANISLILRRLSTSNSGS